MSSARPSDLEVNRHFYDGLWTGARLVEPQRFNTWPIVCDLVARSTRRLEVAPGLRPRLPVEGTHFVDISEPALRQLRARAASARRDSITALPFADAEFDLVCAFDVVEHVDDEAATFHELSRVCAPDGTLLLSVPLHPEQWTAFDEFVGHRRRYEPQRLIELLDAYGFGVERSAVHGMQPQSSWLLEFGMWGLTHKRRQAMWLYNRVLMPLGIRFQKKLELRAGMIDTTGVDTVLLVCRKARGARA
ncbi:MAG TPA: methyltransferase domain-containing protein [Burkholderiales bacterium]|jgi:SAM-dependent methyltransferase|nr:methyltransferase domain-containing protein [Burkholderiales bacterium]